MGSTVEKSGQLCCFCGQNKTVNGTPDFRLDIALPGTDENVITWSHENCFIQLQNTSVLPDNPEEFGSIPPKAKCVFCAKSLPRVGSHPYCFDVGENIPPKRYWAHSECLAERIKSPVKGLLK